MFVCILQKTKQASEDIPVFEKLQVKQAKDIIKPFILRRLKRDVLRHLPKKYDEMVVVPMVSSQREQYEALVNQFKRIGDEVSTLRKKFVLAVHFWLDVRWEAKRHTTAWQ